jgi:hypothetical protein
MTKVGVCSAGGDDQVITVKRHDAVADGSRRCVDGIDFHNRHANVLLVGSALERLREYDAQKDPTPARSMVLKRYA